MGLIHYQTLEAVAPEELRILRGIKEKFNMSRRSNERIRLWRKDDILSCLEPHEARWGFSKVRGRGDGLLLRALEEMSEAVPRLTWIVYDEEYPKEFVLKAGELGSEGRVGSRSSRYTSMD